MPCPSAAFSVKKHKTGPALSNTAQGLCRIMYWGDEMTCPDGLPAAVGALAAAIAAELGDDELALLSAILVQLGDSMTLILARRACAGKGAQSSEPGSLVSMRTQR